MAKTKKTKRKSAKDKKSISVKKEVKNKKKVCEFC